MKKSKKSLNYFEAHPNKRKPLRLKYTQGPDYKLRNYKKRFLNAIGAASNMAGMFSALAGVIHTASRAFGALSHATAHTTLGRVQIIPHTQFPEVIVLRTGERLQLPPMAPIRMQNFEQLRELNEQHDPGDEHHPKSVQSEWNDRVSRVLAGMGAAAVSSKIILPIVDIDNGILKAKGTLSPEDFNRMKYGTWLHKEPEPGYCKGEVCNRDGCKSLIQEHQSDGGCSCHINPPCSWCETSREYCPGCGWDGKEEQDEYHINNIYKPSEAQQKAWAEERRKWDESEQNFNAKFYGKEPITEFECRRRSHTHFSMEVIGVYPDSMTMEEVAEKVRGTFGGRFEMFGKGKFKYIAYTD